MDDLDVILADAYSLGLARTGEGQVAHYIPELAKADPGQLGIAICTLDGACHAAGDADAPFTLQSAGKVFVLACVMRAYGMAVFDHVSVEPSGDAFHSIVRLEEERGRPRNPYINAGAILVSGLLPGADATAKVAALQAFLSEICDQTPFPVDEAVYRSEAATGFRNRALAHFMRQHGRIEDPDLAVDAYFRQCAVDVTARRLARIGLFLANGGVDPVSGRRIIDADCARTVVALMTTCGLYDEVGDYAVRVGLPAKSAVSGAILSIVPGRMAIASYGPALGPKGNSVAGMAVMAFLSNRLGLSVFG